MNYYNDNDRFVAAWLRELIKDGLIPQGEVDEQPIEEVRPDDLRGYTQCHFFAGIGGWSRALQLAGWAADEPVWTGSCPCQPFSAAGKRLGQKDERHLWPEFLRLIRECHPKTIFGEQVASAEVVGTELEAAFVVAVQGGDYARANKLAHKLFRSRSLHYWVRWIDGIRTDMEAEGYSVRFDVLGAHSVGAPHIRQRLFWVAHSVSNGRENRIWKPCDSIEASGVAESEHAERRQIGINGVNGRDGKDCGRAQAHGESGTCREVCGVGNSQYSNGRAEHQEYEETCGRPGLGGPSEACGMGISHGTGSFEGWQSAEAPRYGDTTVAAGFWSDSIWHPCRDGKLRRIPAQPEIFPLVAGVPNQVGTLRGAGNSIVPQIAAEFIRAFIDSRCVAGTGPSTWPGEP